MEKVNLVLEGIALPYRGLTGRAVKTMAARAMKALHLENSSVAFILTGNEFIKKINSRFRKKKSATDVISFPNRENRFPAAESRCEDLGDIFISLEKADAQAGTGGISLHDEVKRLIVHGLLHLAGFDHEKSKKDMEIMQKKENEILSLIP